MEKIIVSRTFVQILSTQHEEIKEREERERDKRVSVIRLVVFVSTKRESFFLVSLSFFPHSSPCLLVFVSLLANR